MCHSLLFEAVGQRERSRRNNSGRLLIIDIIRQKITRTWFQVFWPSAFALNWLIKRSVRFRVWRLEIGIADVISDYALRLKLKMLRRICRQGIGLFAISTSPRGGGKRRKRINFLSRHCKWHATHRSPEGGLLREQLVWSVWQRHSQSGHHRPASGDAMDNHSARDVRLILMSP